MVNGAKIPVSLFDGPLARGKDPDSSHAAADRMVASGARESNCAKVLKALRRWPSSTSRELSRRMGFCRYETARRLPDLERQGKARRGESLRICGVTDRLSIAWYPVEGESC